MGAGVSECDYVFFFRFLFCVGFKMYVQGFQLLDQESLSSLSLGRAVEFSDNALGWLVGT